MQPEIAGLRLSYTTLSDHLPSSHTEDEGGYDNCHDGDDDPHLQASLPLAFELSRATLAELV
jgi:hypothetical protein